MRSKITVAICLFLLHVPQSVEAEAPKGMVHVGKLQPGDKKDRVHKQSLSQVHGFKLEKGQTYLIEVTSSEFDPFLRLEDGAGTEIATNDNAEISTFDARISFLPTRTQKYQLTVTSTKANQTGTYRLTVHKLRTLDKPKTFEGKLTSQSPRVGGRSYSLHKITLRANRWYLLELQSKQFDPALALLDRWGQVLAQDNDGGPGHNARMVFYSPTERSHLLQVLTFQPGKLGSYHLDLHECGGSTPQQDLAPEEKPVLIHGKFTRKDPFHPKYFSSCHYKIHPLKLQQGEVYVLYMAGVNVDPFLRIEDDRGRRLADNNDGPVGTQSRLMFIPDRTGTYHIVASTNKAKQTGPYILCVERYRHRHQALRRQRIEQLIGREMKVAHQLFGRQLYTQALEYGKQPLARFRKLYPQKDFPQGHPMLASGIYALGIMAYVGKAPDQTLHYLHQAWAMHEKLGTHKHHPEGHPLLALMLEFIGEAHYTRGAYGDALTFQLRALAMKRKLFPSEEHPDGHPRLAQALVQVARTHSGRGEHDKAAHYLAQALAMKRKLYPEKDHPRGHREIATGLNDLGAAYEARGELTKALDYYRQALKMYQQLDPKKQNDQGQNDQANTLYNAGSVLVKQGKYGEALPCLQQALETRLRVNVKLNLPDGDARLADILIALGGLYTYHGELDQALHYMQQALKAQRRLYLKKDYPDGHPLLAKNLGNIGVLHEQRGEHKKAAEYYQKSVEMLQKMYPTREYPRGHPDLAAGLANLASSYKWQGDVTRANQYYLQALQMFQDLYPPQKYPRGHPALSRILASVGNWYSALGKHDQAIKHLKQAMEIDRNLYPREKQRAGHPDLASNHHNLGVAYFYQRMYAEAVRHQLVAMKMYQQWSQTIARTASETEALNLRAQLPPTRDFFLSATAHLKPSPNYYQMLWNGRAIVTRVIARRHQDLRANTDPKTRQLARELQQKRERLAYLLLHPNKTRATQDEIAQLTRTKEQLERMIATQLKLPSRDSTQSSPELLQKALPRGTVFLDLVRYIHVEPAPPINQIRNQIRTPRYVAFVVTSGRIQRVALGSAERIETTLKLWREAISKQRSDRLLARKLRELIWNKLQKHLPEKTHTLYIASEGPLTRLPWAALPGKRKHTILLDHYTLASVPHGQFLLEQLKAKPRARDAGQVLLLGAVNYDDFKKPTTKTPTRPLLSWNTRGPRLKELRKWPALKATAREIEQIARHIPTMRVRKLTGTEATTQEVLRQLPHSRIAHLATHGFFAEEQFRSAYENDESRFERVSLFFGQQRRFQPGARNPLVLSGIVLAGANREKTPHRGILTADAIVGQDLHQLQLAVLSACETGLGEIDSREGVFGLPKAFHVAGCPDVVVSLWKVPDAPTAALMNLFYHNLFKERLVPIQALRRAQLAIHRNPKDIPRWALGKGLRGGIDLSRPIPITGTPPALAPRRAPTHQWAAFVLSGVGQKRIRPPERKK